MFDNIMFIGDQDVQIKLKDTSALESDIMNMPLILQDNEKNNTRRSKRIIRWFS